MHQPKTWWAGLLPVAALWALGTGTRTEGIESDLASKAKAIVAGLPADTLDAAVVRVEGRDVSLAGVGFSQASAMEARSAIENQFGVRHVEVGLTTLATAKPYVFSVRRNANQLLLDGFTPLPSVRVGLVGAARAAAPGLAIVDALKYAGAAPDGYEVQTGYALGEASKLIDGAAIVSDGAYSIAGEAATFAIYDSAMAATRALPAGLTLGKAEILPPVQRPFVWGAIRNASGLTLTGFAPTDAARSAIAARAASVFPGVTLTNNMRVARGAPAGDFAAHAAYGLAELGKLSSGEIGLADTAYSISGEAPTNLALDAAQAATRQLPQGLTLARAAILPPEVKPFVWAATHEANVLTLTGYAPDEAARTSIAARAANAFAGVQIDNKLQLARGAPAGDFGAATAFALAELGKLSQGKASFADAQFSLSGMAKANVSNSSVASDARTGLPAGYSLAAIDVKEALISAYVFNAEKTDGKVRLTGFYPDPKSHQDIVAAVKSRFAGDILEDQLVEGRGAPANFASGVIAGLASLSRLATGAFSLNNTGMNLKGDAFYASAAAQIGGAFATGASGFRGQSEVSVKALGPALEAAACQPELRALLGKGRILFETARADLHETSTALLDRIAFVALRCAGAVAEIEVAGHTDADGSTERNLALSKRRAQAVVDYLVAAGVDSGRLNAVGFGEERPVASNDTDEGKAQNRRIEMSVK